jgi:hypothetical protein
MPLQTAPNPRVINAFGDIPLDTPFVIFYSSRDERGEMWCPVRPSTVAQVRCSRLSGPIRIVVWSKKSSTVFSATPKAHLGLSCMSVSGLSKLSFCLPLVRYPNLAGRWKTPANPFRAAPWKIQSIPTIVRLKEVRRPGLLSQGSILTFSKRCAGARDWEAGRD